MIKMWRECLDGWWTLLKTNQRFEFIHNKLVATIIVKLKIKLIKMSIDVTDSLARGLQERKKKYLKTFSKNFKRWYEMICHIYIYLFIYFSFNRVMWKKKKWKGYSLKIVWSLDNRFTVVMFYKNFINNFKLPNKCFYCSLWQWLFYYLL